MGTSATVRLIQVSLYVYDVQENSRLGRGGVEVVKEKRVKIRISYTVVISVKVSTRGGVVGKEYGLKIIYLIYSIQLHR